MTMSGQPPMQYSAMGQGSQIPPMAGQYPPPQPGVQPQQGAPMSTVPPGQPGMQGAYPPSSSVLQQQMQYQHLQQQHQQQLQMFWQQQMQDVEQASDFKNHQLPLARIKKIMKADEDVRMISAEAPVVFSKACEMFILELTLRSWIHTEENKRRTLQKNDIAGAITRTDIFDFLVDIVPRDELKEEGLNVARAQVPIPGADMQYTNMYYAMPPAGTANMQQPGLIPSIMVGRPPMAMDPSGMYGQNRPPVQYMQQQQQQQQPMQGSVPQSMSQQSMQQQQQQSVPPNAQAQQQGHHSQMQSNQQQGMQPAGHPNPNQQSIQSQQQQQSQNQQSLAQQSQQSMQQQMWNQQQMASGNVSQ